MFSREYWICKIRTKKGKEPMNINVQINNERNKEIISNIVEDIKEITLCIKTNDNMTLNVKATSFSFSPNHAEEVEEVEGVVDDDTIDHNTPSFSTIFSDDIDNPSGRRGVVEKIAATKAPHSRAERQYAIKTKEETENNNNFKKLHPDIDNDNFKKFIANKDEFFKVLELNKHKKSDIDIDSITNIREKAVAMEAKEMAESINIPSYIVNEKYGSLMINDMGINLLLNSPLDLSRFSARRLYNSSDLRTLLANGSIRFISPQEAASIIEQTANMNEGSTSDTFSSHIEAERAISGEVDDENTDEIDLERNINDTSSEQEKLFKQTHQKQLTNLTNRNGVRKSFHGNGHSASTNNKLTQNNKPTSNKPTIKPTIKPISKKF